MAGFKFNQFSGILPRLSASLLPPVNATVAENCDFAYGELRNLKGDFLIQPMANIPASIYTDDGLLFYSWTDDVDAVRSPLSRDTFNRLYYTTPTDFRVTSRDGMLTNGGQPASSYRVGVPKPTAAPVLTAAAEPTLSATAVITGKFHYEYGGVKYQETDVTLRVVGKSFTFTPPAKAADPDTPALAFPVIKLTIKDSTTNLVAFEVYSDNSRFANSGDTWRATLEKNADGTTYTVTLALRATDADKKTTAYLYTYVNTYGEEGPPSPSAEITAIASLDIAVIVTRDVQSADYAPIKEIRVYRTPSGSDIADYFYVGAVSVLTATGTTFTFSDNIASSALNEPLASTNYYPPDPALVGLMSLPNGILAAWKGNELHFSDAYKPWSWPPAYVKTFLHNIVGAVAHGSGALVTTIGKPLLISGISPDSMSETKLNTTQAGVSKWSIAEVGDKLAYASKDGLVIVEGGMATLAYSEQFFTRDVWRSRYAAGFLSMRFSVWDGRLIVYSSTGAFVPFMIRLDEAAGSMTTLPGFVAACSFVSPVSDQCYFTKVNLLYQFAGGSDMAGIWQSRELIQAQPVNFGIAQFIGSGSWSIAFYSNDKDGNFVLRYTKDVTGPLIFRLPGGFLSDRWQVRASGTGRFRELYVAQTAQELGEV